MSVHGGESHILKITFIGFPWKMGAGNPVVAADKCSNLMGPNK
jgi:hypothetical protein